jgi:hypothetical protein
VDAEEIGVRRQMRSEGAGRRGLRDEVEEVRVRRQKRSE